MKSSVIKPGVLEKLGVKTDEDQFESENLDIPILTKVRLGPDDDHDNHFKIGLYNDEQKLDFAVRKEMRKNYDDQSEGFDLNNIGANEYEKMKILN